MDLQKVWQNILAATSALGAINPATAAALFAAQQQSCNTAAQPPSADFSAHLASFIGKRH